MSPTPRPIRSGSRCPTRERPRSQIAARGRRHETWPIRPDPTRVPPSTAFSCLPPVHGADLEGQQRADSAPTKAASGRTGVRAKAVNPLRGRKITAQRSRLSIAPAAILWRRPRYSPKRVGRPRSSTPSARA
jgi:hypothetical protein